MTQIMMKMMIMTMLKIMRCLITATNASSFSQANAHGSGSDLTVMALRKIFYGDDYSFERKVSVV